MKKIIAVLAALSVLCSLCACNFSDKGSSSTIEEKIFNLTEENDKLKSKISDLQVTLEQLTEDDSNNLTNKKIVYDGDSICESRLTSANNGGAYAKLIADIMNCKYENQAVGGATLTTLPDSKHSLVNNLENLPKDGDLYCFQGGINDYWNNVALGTYSKTSFTDTPDTTTICGALEYIFRYSLNTFEGKPICFIITHKIQETAYKTNAAGNTFEDYHDAMVGICNKYSIPYYDAFMNSGLNGWNRIHSEAFLNANASGTPDGCHPNEEAYRRYYVPQLIELFESMIR